MFLREAMVKYLRENPGARFEQFAAWAESSATPLAAWPGERRANAQSSPERCLFELARVTEIRETAEAVDAILAGPTFRLQPEALLARNSDSLDFHDVSIWQLREALAEAYRRGRNAGAV